VTDDRMIYWVNQYAVGPDQPGGTRHHEIARELRRRGWAVTVVASDLHLASRTYTRRRPGSRTAMVEQIDGVPFVWLYASHYQANDARRVLSMLTFGVHAFRHLLRAPMQNSTIVIGSSPHLLGAAAAKAVAALRGRRFILEVRDLWPESLQVTGRSGGLLYWGLRQLADALYRHSDAIIVLAEGSVPRIRERAPRAHITFVPNGVDVELFDSVPASSARWPADRTAFIYAGAHGPANGLDVVVDAAHILHREEYKRAHIVLIGDGPQKAALMGRVAGLGLDNVTFLEPVPKSEVAGLLKAADVGLMVLAPVKLFEDAVSPNKLFDYLSAGLTVLGNIPGEVASLIEDAGSGISVRPGSATALAEGIRLLCEREDRSSRGRDWVAEHRDRRVLALEVERLIEALPARRRFVRARGLG
jgi:glycosyltransferase involved in cell wall biosynthesis